MGAPYIWTPPDSAAVHCKCQEAAGEGLASLRRAAPSQAVLSESRAVLSDGRRSAFPVAQVETWDRALTCQAVGVASPR